MLPLSGPLDYQTPNMDDRFALLKFVFFQELVIFETILNSIENTVQTLNSIPQLVIVVRISKVVMDIFKDELK